MMEAVVDITATCDVSRLEVEGKLFDNWMQGGVLADGMNGCVQLPPCLHLCVSVLYYCLSPIPSTPSPAQNSIT